MKPITPKPAKTMGPYLAKSTSDGIDGPWIVTHIGEGGMVVDWWQPAPGKILMGNGNLGGGSAAIFPDIRIL